MPLADSFYFISPKLFFLSAVADDTPSQSYNIWLLLVPGSVLLLHSTQNNRKVV